MMKTVRTSETSVDNHFTRQYIPEDNSEHHTRRRENLKSHVPSSNGQWSSQLFYIHYTYHIEWVPCHGTTRPQVTDGGRCTVRSFIFCKGKAVPLLLWRRRGKRRYSSCPFLNSALDGVNGQRYAPAAPLLPGKGPPVLIGQEAGWAPEPVWTQKLEEKSFCLFRG
jgi:hypothetical protein